jgi:prolyl oligopeptidase
MHNSWYYRMSIIGLLWLAACGGKSMAPEWDQHPAYPPSRRDDVKDVLHGVEIRDPYRWLEDASRPEVQSWMKAQDALARDYLKALPARSAIVERLKPLYYADEIFPPAHRGNRYFYERRHASKEKVVTYWREGKEGEEKILFDPNTWSSDGSVSLGNYSVTEDGRTVAYTIHRNNSDEATMYVMDAATGRKHEADQIEGAKYAYASWTPDGKGFYYTWLPSDPKISAADRPGFAEVRFHRLGENPGRDKVIHPKTGDPTTFIGAGASRDGHWLILQIQHGWLSNDVWFRDLRGNQDTWTSLVTGTNAMYKVLAWRDVFYVQTNEDAPRYRIFRVDPQKPARAQWSEIVPQREDATLDGMGIVGEHLALTYLKDGASRLEVHTLDGRFVRGVSLPGTGTAWGLLGNEDEDEAYYGFLSYTVPREIYMTSVKSGETRLWSRLSVPVDPSPYVVNQVWYPSRDGTRVSMFLVHRKDLKKDGSAPTLLYGYGGFQVSLTPAFKPSIYAWLERGGVYAEANLRGGSEYGENWHRAGMLENKQNVFDDFAAAANFLIGQGYTRPDRLAVEGGSNGGLLVGAAMTQNPGLYRVVICAVPLLDMLRYHLFGSGKTWMPEYGSPDDPLQFKTLYAYSPYHHVKEGTRYPALLLLSADSDDRVDPMHARKFAAAMQNASAGGSVYLRIESHAGHGGADLIRATIEKEADKWAFILAQMGLK